MMHKFRVLTFIMLPFFLVLNACTHLDKSEYVEWVKDEKNNLTTSYIDGKGVVHRIMFKPSSLRALQEYEEMISSQEELVKYKEEFKSTYTFEYRIYDNLIDSLDMNSSYKIKYGTADLFRLRLDSTLVEPIGYHLEKYDAVKPYTSFNILFNRGVAEVENVAFIIKENNYNIPIRQFEITKNDLNNEPLLKL